MVDEKIVEWRKEIDEINSDMLDLLNKRIELVKKIGKVKKQKDIPIVDSKREEEIYERLGKLADKKGLDRKFVKDIFKRIIDEAIKEEKWQKA